MAAVGQSTPECGATKRANQPPWDCNAALSLVDGSANFDSFNTIRSNLGGLQSTFLGRVVFKS